jgi:hypothetical protein
MPLNKDTTLNVALGDTFILVMCSTLSFIYHVIVCEIRCGSHCLGSWTLMSKGIS